MCVFLSNRICTELLTYSLLFFAIISSFSLRSVPHTHFRIDVWLYKRWREMTALNTNTYKSAEMKMTYGNIYTHTNHIHVNTRADWLTQTYIHVYIGASVNIMCAVAYVLVHTHASRNYDAETVRYYCTCTNKSKSILHVLHYMNLAYNSKMKIHITPSYEVIRILFLFIEFLNVFKSSDYWLLLRHEPCFKSHSTNKTNHFNIYTNLYHFYFFVFASIFSNQVVLNWIPRTIN